MLFVSEVSCLGLEGAGRAGDGKNGKNILF